jgi:glycosyltransferase involved in cell wall biosynthesis
VSAVPSDPVGAGRYILNLSEALARRDDVELTLWCRRGDVGRWAPLVGNGRDRGVASVLRPVVPGPRPLRLSWEQLRLPALLRSADVEVHHGPHYTMPERARLPMVVTIHDLTFLTNPEWHERTKARFFGRAIALAARRATALVCVSATTASRLEELCHPSGRVFVIPHGVDRSLFRPDEPEPGSDAEVLARLGVRAPFVVFVGTLEPRKAVPDLVTAFDHLADTDADLRLVLVGRPGWGLADIEKAIDSSRHGQRVIRLGYVHDRDVPALLRRCQVAAYPALEEGFGLPALEALSCGAPLVTTRGTAMAEVSGEAALFVPPGRPGDLAEAIGAALEGGPARDRRRRLGLEVASNYTWSACAKRHRDAYRWAVGATGGSGPRTADGDR